MSVYSRRKQQVPGKLPRHPWTPLNCRSRTPPSSSNFSFEYTTKRRTLRALICFLLRHCIRLQPPSHLRQFFCEPEIPSHPADISSRHASDASERASERSTMARWSAAVLCCLMAALVLASTVPEVVGAGRELAESIPAGVSLSFPPFTSALNCSFDASIPATPDAICTPSTDPSAPPQIVFSYDNDVIDVRYQYTSPVQLYKKGTQYAASISTSFVINIDRDSERSVQRVFGGGIALAITPRPTVGVVGTETIGLFPIDQATGNPLGGQDPRTVAVEIDTSTTFDWDLPTVPHVGLDVNSLKSVASSFLWNGTDFVNRKVGVFVDYDAEKESLEVRFQNITTNGKADKKKAKVFLSYTGLKLSNFVNEYSYVGFSSRVPVTDDGVYRLYEWKFTTTWVKTTKKQ